MSVTITLAELADMAFGTADGPQISALRVLLRGLLEHLHPQEAAAQVGENERGLLEPVAGGKPCSLHQQRRPWLGRAEGQLSCPSGPLGTGTLGPLKKRMEVTEEGMTKVRNHPLDGAHPWQGATTGSCSVWPPALCSILSYRGSCSTQRAVLHQHPALRGVLASATHCLTRCTALGGILPYAASCPCSDLPHLVLYAVSHPTRHPATHSVQPYVVSCPTQ